MRVPERWMAEIRPLLSKNIILPSGYLNYILLILLLLPIQAFNQDKKVKQGKRRIELIYADSNIIVKEKGGIDVHHLVGMVQLKHNEITMNCDSAHFVPEKDQVTAFSKIHIEQGDTLDLYGNYLFYDGKSEIAIVRDSVELVDKETHLYTDRINYDVRNRIARYDTGGRITNADNTLTSISGIYYVSDKLFHFKDSVKIVNPEYVMTADTMDYNTETETSYFTGPTELNGDSLYMYCEKGWYDTRNEITSVWKNALIDNRKQIITGDSLFYNDSTGYGEGYRNVLIRDTTNHIAIEGDYAWYFKQPESFLVTKRAVFIQVSNKTDSLFMHADTISAVTVTDTISSYRLMKAFYGVKVFSKDLQARCDSLSYSYRDSVIRFYDPQKPVMWTEENQLTADSMAIFTKNRQAERLELYTSAFVASQVDSIRFNQIKGRSLTGFFRDNELYKIDIRGNGESIYYLIDQEEIAGVNHSKCARIEATVEDGKVSVITDIGAPEGVIDPPGQTNPAELKLEGFSWLDHIRPKKKSDIFIR